MAADFTRTRKLLAASDFKTLFIEELGWNHHNARMEIPFDGLTVTLSAVAEKCGMAAFVCAPGAVGRMPDYAMRRKIERQATKKAPEHLIIFIDGTKTTQLWQWVRCEQGEPAACWEHTYTSGQPGDSLIQKLQALAVSLEEDECLTLTDCNVWITASVTPAAFISGFSSKRATSLGVGTRILSSPGKGSRFLPFRKKLTWMAFSDSDILACRIPCLLRVSLNVSRMISSGGKATLTGRSL
jgi:hypothetical protein